MTGEMKKYYCPVCLAAAFVLCFTPIIGAALAEGGAEQGKLAQNESYAAARREFEEAVKSAKDIMSPGDYAELERENAAWERDMKAGYEEGVQNSSFTEDFNLADAYAQDYSARREYVETEARRGYLKKNPDGAQGLFAMDDGRLKGILEVEFLPGDSETELYRALVDVMTTEEPYNGGTFEGTGVLEGGKMTIKEDGDEAALTLVFKGDTVELSSNEAFREAGYAGAGVYFDGSYIRQKARK
jgi:hypothetical protein